MNVCEVVFPFHIHLDTGGFVDIVHRDNLYKPVYMDGREDIDIVRYAVNGLPAEQCREWKLPPVTTYSSMEHSVILRGPRVSGGPITLEVDTVEDEILYVKDPLLPDKDPETIGGISGAIAYIRPKTFDPDSQGFNVPIGIALGPQSDAQGKRTGLFQILLFRFAAGDLRLRLRIHEGRDQNNQSSTHSSVQEQKIQSLDVTTGNSAFVAATGRVAPLYLTQCDLKAANPADSGRHPIVTRPYSWHKLNSDDAITACNQDIAKRGNFGRLLYQLGRAYSKKFDETKNPEWAGKAFTELSNALELGYSYSLTNIHDLIFSKTENRLCDKGRPGDCEHLFLAILNSAQHLNDAEINYHQGYANLTLRPEFLDCKTREKCAVTAAKLYKKASKLGVARATRDLGYLYLNQKGVTDCSDQTSCDLKAVELFRLAADKGDANAIGQLGWMYYNKRGVTDCEGEACWRRSVEFYSKASDLGEVWATRNLGHLYKDQEGVTDCSDQASCDLKAVELFRLAADEGDARAMTSLGWLYESQKMGVECKDFECLQMAADIYHKAAGLDKAEAYRALGGLHRSLALSYDWENAVLTPGKITCNSAKTCVTDAVKYYQRSADLGNANAYAWLGDMYNYGEVGDLCRGKDCITTALELYKKADDLGNNWAPEFIADIYLKDRSLMNCSGLQECDRIIIDLFLSGIYRGRDDTRRELADLYVGTSYYALNGSKIEAKLCDEPIQECLFLALDTLLDATGSYSLRHGFGLAEKYVKDGDLAPYRERISRYQLKFLFRYLYGSIRGLNGFDELDFSELKRLPVKLVKSIQSVLRASTDYKGSIDGRLGRGSQAALKAYILRECPKDLKGCGL